MRIFTQYMLKTEYLLKNTKRNKIYKYSIASNAALNGL